MSKGIWSPGSPVSTQSRPRLPVGAAAGLRVVAVVIGMAAAAAALGAMSASAFATGAEIEAFARQGISKARAEQALALQGRVAEAKLTRKIIAALGDAYAGVWFEPAAAKFHVGVTSDASRRTARAVAEEAGFGAEVVETPVRSTWSALLDTQTRWNHKLASLIANEQAITGLSVKRNAVEVTLTSSVPASERATLVREAKSENVNVVVAVEPSSRLGLQYAAGTCKAPFVTLEALCERTLTSGVNLWIGGALACTAGPLLIEGNETYMMTAGHCFLGEREGTAEAVRTEVASEYPAIAERMGIGRQIKEIGSEVTRWFNRVNEVAVVKVAAGSSFEQGLPIPVPALMAEWAREPRTPHPVAGSKAAELVEAQMVCHAGMTSGERCGEITRLNVPFRIQAMGHMVETNACGQGGDSGGPWFFRVPVTNEILMMGTMVGIGERSCAEERPYKSYFEPFLEIPRVAGSGSFRLFPRQSLLTTANENRTSNWMLNGRTLTEEGLTSAALKTTAKVVEAGKLAAAGTLSVECTGNLESVKPEIVKPNRAAAESLIFTGCKDTETGCAVPATIGTVLISGELTLEGALAVKGVVKPATGTVLTTIRVTGETCAVAGNKPVTGDVEVLAPEGQDARTDQLLTLNQGATGLLKVLSAAATLKGSVLLLLENGAAWSLL